MTDSQYDVVIIGAGMVGSTLASLLARSHFNVALIEAHEPPVFDASADVGLRVSAISPGSAAILEQAGVWKSVTASRHRPYRRMQIEDGVELDPLLFDAPVFNLERLGTIVENDLLTSSLWQSITSAGMVDTFCPDRLDFITFEGEQNHVHLKSGQTLSVPLLVGADGAASRVRKAVGIKQDHWVYNQHGLVAVIGKEKPNPGVAWQRFFSTGPLAFLPLQDGRSSIVWTLPTIEAQRISALDDDEFMNELEVASSGWLGQVTSCGPRAIFPLNMRLSECYTSQRTVLMGDAAHVVHPLAGQGVNLGFADAAALTESLIKARHAGLDIGKPSTLKKFDRWRRAESETMAFGMHSLSGLFGVDALSPFRHWGMSAVKKSWSLKDMFIRRAAGTSRNAPALATGTSLRDLLRP
jgi:ubiquinone biosynthesis UbiH/UbiF/VisC/COQ6 family hydroxylase